MYVSKNFAVYEARSTKDMKYCRGMSYRGIAMMNGSRLLATALAGKKTWQPDFNTGKSPLALPLMAQNF